MASQEALREARATLSDAEADAKNAERMLADLETAIPKARAGVGTAQQGWLITLYNRVCQAFQCAHCSPISSALLICRLAWRPRQRWLLLRTCRQARGCK